ncbi:sugar transporter [Pararhodobacter sp. SW119]|uniref:sugar transporter n=1 Tax=Pararhodobacter sp. SW119 TaxID=2780075 RepID=UPI001ADED5B5|nr:sugar transporter [Pararhodobacter sp. SW119]
MPEPEKKSDTAVANPKPALRVGDPGGGVDTKPPLSSTGPPAKRVTRQGYVQRNRGFLLSLVLLVLLPVLVSATYLGVFARDQFASSTGFTIRQGETESASEILGGLSQLVGGGSAGNADLLFEFLQSQEIVERIDAQVSLLEHYAATWPQDPVFSIWPDATIEDLHWFWQRMVRVNYNKNSGLIMVQVRARDPGTARDIAQRIVAESEAMINMLNETARRDSMTNAAADLQEALERLRNAREEMVGFRARTQILDPIADIEGRMGVLSNLQQQLAQSLVDFDLLALSADATDPRVRQAARRIEVIRDRIVDERRTFAAQDVTVDNTDYPQLLGQYESLRVDQEFAEQSYRAALTAMDAARTNSERQQLYLATFIQPTLAQRAEYPRRLFLIAMTALFAGLIWAVLALVYFSLRDRG